jgi:hypothetical protein
MREPEGIESPRPGRPKKTPWSKGRDLDVRNVEAVGSNPITSTESPGQGLEVAVPQGFRSVRRDLVGEEGAGERYGKGRRAYRSGSETPGWMTKPWASPFCILIGS